MLSRLGLSAAFVAGFVFGQDQAVDKAPSQAAEKYTVNTGTHLVLGMINTANTKHSAPGDPIYLKTVVPVVINNHIVIPPGSYVNGTVTDVKRPGRVRGRGELYVRFDILILP